MIESKEVAEKVRENNEDYVLSVQDLHTSFFTDSGEVKAVNGVSFNLKRKDSRYCRRIRFRKERDSILDHADT